MTTPVRITVVGVVYAAAALAALPLLEAVRGLLLLPVSFLAFGRWFLVAGLPVALLVAWRYPHLGEDDPG